MTGSKKLVYLIPFTETSKFHLVLKQLEQFNDVFLTSVELTSLEDAYLKIVEQEKKFQQQSGDLSEEKSNEFEKENQIAQYQLTSGKPDNYLQ